MRRVKATRLGGPRRTRRAIPPERYYRDGHSIGQVASMWGRSPWFVKQEIAAGKLTLDERQLITNSALRSYYQTHGHP